MVQACRSWTPRTPSLSSDVLAHPGHVDVAGRVLQQDLEGLAQQRPGSREDIASGLTIAGIDLWVMILVVIAAPAVVQFAGYEQITSGADRASLVTAVIAVILTVLAFDVGMGGWMLLHCTSTG